MYTVRLRPTIYGAGNGALVVHVGEENELLVDKVRVGDAVHLLGVEEGLVKTLVSLLSPVLQPLCQPLLTTLHTLLAECL